MPPNSFYEWVAGQNAPHSSTPKTPRPVFALQLETDDEYESDILKLTYPRTGRTRLPYGKKVRFTDNAHNVKAKEPHFQSSLDLDTDASSTAVEVNSGDDEAATDEDIILDCPCANCIVTRKILKKTNRTKGKSRKQQNVSTAYESNNAAVVHARHKAKKAKEAEALKSKGGSSKRRAKQKSKHANKKSDSEVETTETETDTDAGTGEETGSESESESEPESEKEQHKERGKNKNRQKKRDTQNKKTKQGKQNKKKNKQDSQKTKEGGWDREDKNEKQDEQKDSHKQDTKEEEGVSEQDNLADDMILQEADAIKKKRAEASQYPPQNPPYAPQQANFLMPPHARMLQVEHAVELPNDPRPNAFFDGVHGIMRVYHGPHYGNAYGQLYPNAPYVNQNPTVNVSYPVHNPWHAAGFQPFHGGQPPPPAPPQPPQPSPYPHPQEHPQHPPAATRRAPADNSWFQGYGSVTIGKPPEEAQEAKDSNSTPDPNRKNNEAWSEQHSTPAKKSNSRSDRGGKSNVIPSIEITDPEKPQGSEGARGKSWGTQSDHGSQKVSEFKEEGKNDSNDSDKAQQSGGGGFFEDVIAKAEEVYKTNSERFSPAPLNDDNQAGNGSFGDNNGGGWGGGVSWGDGNNDTAAGDNSWGEKDAQETTTGVTDPSKPAEDNSNGNSSDPAGGNASIDNVAVHGDLSDKKDGDNGSNSGRNNGGKRSKASSKRSTPPKGPPGCWVSNPPSENEESKPRASPDNVGPPASGNGNGKKGKGKGQGKQKENGKSENNQASGSGNGNGGWGVSTGWGDPDVAQSSGGAFDDDDKNKDGKEQHSVEW